MSYHVLEVLPYIELPLINSDQKVLVDGDYDGEYFAQFKWKLLRPTGYKSYVCRDIRKKKHTSSYLAREVARPPKGTWVTYRDGDTLNCRSYNLRWITPRDSALERPQWAQQNRHKSKRQYRGVTQSSPSDRNSRRWRVLIRGEWFPGSFTTPEEAAEKYNELAYAFWGEKAILNKIAKRTKK